MAPSDAGSPLGEKEIFTTGEAARICNVSQQTIIRCFDSGRLRGFKVPGSRFRRIPRDELVRFMRENGIPVEAVATRKRVLLVSDDAEFATPLVRDLDAGTAWEIRHVRTPFAAGAQLESFGPGAIVLDARLAGLDLEDAIVRIGECRALADSLLILVDAPGIPEAARGRPRVVTIRRPIATPELLRVLRAPA